MWVLSQDAENHAALTLLTKVKARRNPDHGCVVEMGDVHAPVQRQATIGRYSRALCRVSNCQQNAFPDVPAECSLHIGVGVYSVLFNDVDRPLCICPDGASGNEKSRA